MKRCIASGSAPSDRFDRFRNKVYCLIAVCLTLALDVPLASAQTTFLTFDTLQGRPIAISPNGMRLFAVDTPGSPESPGRFTLR